MTNEMKFHCVKFISEYIGNLIVDLETKSKDEEEIIKAIKEIEVHVKQDLEARFDTDINIEDLYSNELFLSLDESMIQDSDLTSGEGDIISLGEFTTNQSLLYLLAVKSEMMELINYLHNSSEVIKPHWSLPISETEFAKKLNLEKAFAFLRRY